MGISSDAILGYGFDLGGEDYWLLQEADRDGQLDVLPDWWDEDDGFYESVGSVLPPGVRVVVHCTYDFPMYLLVVSDSFVRVSWGATKAVEDLIIFDEWFEMLREALDALNLTPTQQQPAWLLASVMG